MDLLDEEIEREAATCSRQSSNHDTDSDYSHREATEVEIMMNHRFRISRTRRMNWYLDYHDSLIRLSEPDKTGKKPFQVCGVVTKNGDKLEVDEEFRISSKTNCWFFSKFYKLSFVLDFSPSSFSADGEGNVIYASMIRMIERLLRELIRPFQFTNSQIWHRPEIYVSLMAYCPYIKINQPPTLVHGFRVAESTIDEFVTLAKQNIRLIVKDIIEHIKPLNRKRELLASIRSRKAYRRQQERQALIDRVPKVCQFELMTDVDESIPEEALDLTKDPDNKEFDWDIRINQMVRLGMLGLYPGPETSYPGIVIVTDGNLYIEQQDIIQALAVNLRTQCVPLHFLEISALNGSGIPNIDLMDFLSSVTYGNHIPTEELLEYKAPGNLISRYQKMMLAWSCQRRPYELDPPKSNTQGRIRKDSRKLRSNFYQVFHVRIREGYFLRHLSIIRQGREDYITALLTLPWTCDCSIDYKISALYDDCDERTQEINRDITIRSSKVFRGNYKEAEDSIFTAAIYVTESDRFALKVLSFGTSPGQYEINTKWLSKYPGVYGFTKESPSIPTLLIKSLEKSKFNSFWKPLVYADNPSLHRCAHNFTLRFTANFSEKLNINYWPEEVQDSQKQNKYFFVTDTNDDLNFPGKKYLLDALIEYFKTNTTFCLVARYSYVKIVREDPTKAPEYCYMIKMFANNCILTLNVIFIGDCSLDTRNKTVAKIKNDLLKLEKIRGMLHPMTTGVDGKILRYHDPPETLEIERPFKVYPAAPTIWATREKIHQNILFKLYKPRRNIYKIERDYDDFDVGMVALEAMNVLLRRRLVEGYRVYFVEAGMVHMIKEIPSETPGVSPKIEQFIIFPPHKESLFLKGLAVKQLRNQLTAVGRALEPKKLKIIKASGSIEEYPGGIDDENYLDVEHVERQNRKPRKQRKDKEVKNTKEIGKIEQEIGRPLDGLVTVDANISGEKKQPAAGNTQEKKPARLPFKPESPPVPPKSGKSVYPSKLDLGSLLSLDIQDDEGSERSVDTLVEEPPRVGSNRSINTLTDAADLKPSLSAPAAIMPLAKLRSGNVTPEIRSSTENPGSPKCRFVYFKPPSELLSLDELVAIELEFHSEGRGLLEERSKNKNASEIKEEEPPPPEDEEIYEDPGCFIVSEYWTEPPSFLAFNDENLDRLQHAVDDRAILSALITFRAMQVELGRAPGLGTALIGREAYSLHGEECSAINYAPDVTYHCHFQNLLKLCHCGERVLVLLPTLKFTHNDPHSINRLGRILDSFHHEMRNYMPQCFEFEDTQGTWLALASGLEAVLEEIDQAELLEADEMSSKDYDTDVERVLDETEDSAGTGTGYSTPAGLMSPASFTMQVDTCKLTDELIKMDDEQLRRTVLGSYNKRGIFGSGESLNSPKSPSSSVGSGDQRSTSVPLSSQEDDDHEADFLPSKNKKVSPSVSTPTDVHSPALPLKPSTPPEAVPVAEGKGSKKLKRKKKKKIPKETAPTFMGGSRISLASFDHYSERSRRRALEEAETDTTPLAFYVYYKRRDPKTILVTLVPATCRAVMKLTNSLVPRFPILSFMIEEAKMFDIFFNSPNFPKDFIKTNVENFCARSALAHLNWQVSVKLSESERDVPTPGNYFGSETVDGVDPTFTDLNDFCVNIMHDLIFSRAYTQAAYHCLGTNVHVPQPVLEEVLEERCIQTSISFGSIRDVLRVTCTHLSSYLQSKRVSRYKRHQMPNISPSSSSSESEIEVQQINEYQLMNPFCYSDAENDEICKMEQTEFRLAFENVLRKHKFFKVPAFADYYFYWPNGENTVTLFNSGGAWNEHLDTTPLNKSKMEGSFTDSEDSAVTVVSVDDGHDSNSEEAELDYGIQPLFLQFYVSIPRTDGDVFSYPVDFIPNCLHDVIHRCDPGFFSNDEKKALNEMNVEVEMFVLTVPSVDDRTVVEDRIRRSTEETIDWMLTNRLTQVEDINLPPKERHIIVNLKKGIQNMLETEQILILSRYFDSQKSYKNICHVVEFVERESTRSDDHSSRVQTAQSDMLFITNPEEGLKRLCAKLDGAIVSYCKIRCVKDEKSGSKNPIIFYCCSVEDFETFCQENKSAVNMVKFDFKPKRKQRLVTSDSDDEVTEESTLVPSSAPPEESLGEDEVFDFNVALKDSSTKHLDDKVKRKQIIHDFWLLAKLDVDPMRMKSYFFQRPNGVHGSLFKQFTDLLIEEIKLVNQALLLEELHETMKCSTYLIDDETVDSNLGAQEELPLIPQYHPKFLFNLRGETLALEEENEDLISQCGSSNTSQLSQESAPDLLSPITYRYVPGYFFCPMVWKRWYTVNPRLRKNSVDMAMIALRSGLENLAVKNHQNVYVFKESNGHIFYMYLLASGDAIHKVCRNPSDEWQNEVDEFSAYKILFAVFGIHPPSEEITVQFANILQKKLDMKLLDELQKALLKNPQLTLTVPDLYFIQPEAASPSSNIIFSLPTISKDYLASVFAYLQQHLSRYFTRLPSFPGDTILPYPVDGDAPIPKDYEAVAYLVNKPKAGGQRSYGIGCFEMRLVDKFGRLARREGGFPPGKLNANSFSLLYPGFSGNERLQKTARFHELTKCVQIDSFEAQGHSINSHHFMQFFIWQVGDIGLAELQTRLRIFCLQALADLIVEFGVMSQSFLEPVSVPQSPAMISRPSSLVRQGAVDQKAHLRKRGSTTIPEALLSQPVTPMTIPAPMSPGLASPTVNIVPPTIMALDTLPKNSLLQKPLKYGTKLEDSSQLFSTWNEITSMGGHRLTARTEIPQFKTVKVTQFATDLPPLPHGPAEYLRLDFIPATTAFFYHMERETRAYSDILQSFQKFRFDMDGDHVAPTIMRVLYAKLYHAMIPFGDSIIIMKKVQGSDGSNRLQTIKDTDALSAPAVTSDKGHVIDFAEDYSDVDYVILVFNRRHMDEMIHQSLDPESAPIDEIRDLSRFPHDSYFNFGPVLKPCFVPRRRLFFITIRGEALSLFLYNVNPEKTTKVKDVVEKAIHWNNARSRLLREIGLHKMQITHLNTLKSPDPKIHYYQSLIWKAPEFLIAYDYPPDKITSTDFTKMPKHFARMFLKIYRFTDPAYVLKQNTKAKFDDQTAQLLAMREKVVDTLNDYHIFNEYHNRFLQAYSQAKFAFEDVKVRMEEKILNQLLTRCEDAHYVQTPLLLFPEWRKKVAAIRALGNDYGSVGKRKHSAPPTKPVKKQSLSLEPKMKPRSKTVNVTMLPTMSRSTSDEEPCSLRIQYMLTEEYSNYLMKHLGARRILILPNNPDNSQNPYSLEYNPETTVSPIVWLYLAYAGGFILIQLHFIEPYFSLRLLFWNRGQLFDDQSIQDLRSFIKEKNQIVSKCHLHSFTYDFHLRMVKTYLVGGLLFNRGYNTNAFLIDFLQYYSCRPPFSRNCIYEENCTFIDLRVPGTNVWNNFLNRENRYGWRVVKLKEKEKNDEHMLISEVPKKIFDREYEGVRVITHVPIGSNNQEHKLLIRYYVIMVSKDAENPMLETLCSIPEPFPLGEFKRLPDELFLDPELEDEFLLDLDTAYDSDARASSGSNSDKSQRMRHRQSTQSVASLASGNNSNDRLSDFDPPLKGYASPCASPMSQTLVDFTAMTPLLPSGNFDALELRTKLSCQAVIQKVPPRGHRKNASISSDMKNYGAILPEQVIYVHYFNNLQKKLQSELEDFARASKIELENLVGQADLECHIEALWTKLLSMDSIWNQKKQMSLLSHIGHKLESNQEPVILLKSITSTDLSHAQWLDFMNIIKIINMEKEEPKLVQIFHAVDYMKLFKFLLLHYEGDKRCRYFDFSDSKNLVITNPNCLSAASLFRYRVAEKKIELLMIIKEHDFRGQDSHLFGMNAIHKQFEEILHCLSSYLWKDLLVMRPNPQRQ